MTLHELVTRLEAATGPDWELDNAIRWAVGDRAEYVNQGGFYMRHKVTGKSERYDYSVAPLYTSSLDAALQLVPEGNEFHFLRGAPIGKLYLFEHRAPSEYGWTQGAIVHRGEHDHAAIAVCIAALKARSQP